MGRKMRCIGKTIGAWREVLCAGRAPPEGESAEGEPDGTEAEQEEVRGAGIGTGGEDKAVSTARRVGTPAATGGSRIGGGALGSETGGRARKASPDSNEASEGIGEEWKGGAETF